MNRRILIIEPDATIRRMMEHALASAGFAPTSVATIELSRAVLDQKPIEAVIVELRATNAEGTEGVRALRADYPELPMIVMGTLMTTRVMEELIRRRVDGVVPKPFTPRELVGALERVLREAKTRGAGGMEYAAAMVAARRAIVEGRPRDAESPLERARAASPLDSEAMALLALCRELEGCDEDADRGYRASLALQSERVTEDAMPTEGLARLQAYAGARVVPSFDHKGRHVLWFVDAATELSLGSPSGVSPDVVVFALGLVPNEVGATYARLGRERAFLVSTATMNERLALRIARTFDAPKIVAHPASLARIGSAAEEGGAHVEPQQA
jgi:DNA-binding response OmpR family regulator